MSKGEHTVAEKLEALARRLPGVRGYLDRERARETDHAVRAEIARRLEGARQAVESLQRRLADAHEIELLGVLGRLTAKLDRLLAKVRFAARGYRGVFDTYKLRQETLERVIEFDLAAIDRAAALHEKAAALSVLRDAAELYEAARGLDGEMDAFDAQLADREALFVPRPAGKS